MFSGHIGLLALILLLNAVGSKKNNVSHKDKQLILSMKKDDPRCIRTYVAAQPNLDVIKEKYPEISVNRCEIERKRKELKRKRRIQIRKSNESNRHRTNPRKRLRNRKLTKSRRTKKLQKSRKTLTQTKPSKRKVKDSKWKKLLELEKEFKRWKNTRSKSFDDQKRKNPSRKMNGKFFAHFQPHKHIKHVVH